MTTRVEEQEVAGSKTSTLVKQRIKWGNVVLLTVVHLLALYAAVVVLPQGKLITFIWILIYGYMGAFGVTAGAHRYWTHRSYKAKLPLRILLAAMYLIAGMNPLFHWVRDHRIHHTYSETDADPHNARRGLFFSHVGWLMQSKHPEVLRRGKEVDMSDVMADPVVRFEEKYFTPLVLIFAFVIPVCIPCLLWGESWWISFMNNIFRWVCTLNIVWSVNSFAHTYGYRPYNRKINPAENVMVAALAVGEGWHNYHHQFPWDYKTAELGDYSLNFTTAFIDFFAYIGWAYGLKQPSKNLVQRVVQKLGDGSHTEWGHVTEVPEEDENRLIANENIEELLLEAEEKSKTI